MAGQPGGTVRIQTDHPLMVAYDPLLLRERVRDKRSWWEAGPFRAAERLDARYALWPLGGEGGLYRVRLALEADGLTEAERPFVAAEAEPAPLRVVGAEVFLGPASRLPGDGFGDRLPALPGGGALLPLEAGGYLLTPYVLDWRQEERFWDDEGEPTADAPVDVVLLATRVEGDLPAPPPEVKPLLDYLPQKTPRASKRVVHATRPRPVSEPEAAPRRRGAGTGTRRAPAASKTATAPAPAVRPGELCVGATVRHPIYGVGKVAFVKDGFPKARVIFQSGDDEKVDKVELQVLS